VLANGIDQALLRNRTVTLVGFDLKGAFNGVHETSLDAQLREWRIPVLAREWIRNSMQDRTASIKFDGYETAIEPLHFAGLAQGSPLFTNTIRILQCRLG
jgi:hypothetical protein